MKTEVVYLIGSDDARLVKIGRTNNITLRLATIQKMSPVQLRVIWTTEGGSALESALHRKFRDLRTHGEWFDFGGLSPEVTVAAAMGSLDKDDFIPTGEAEAAYIVAIEQLDISTERIKELRNALQVAETESRPIVANALRACVAAGRPRTEVQKRAAFSPPVVRSIGEENGIPPDERYVRTQKRADSWPDHRTPSSRSASVPASAATASVASVPTAWRQRVSGVERRRVTVPPSRQASKGTRSTPRRCGPAVCVRRSPSDGAPPGRRRSAVRRRFG